MKKPPQGADIVTRLRYSGSLSEVAGATLEDEAADKIERLRDVLERLRASMHACNRNPIPNSKRVEWRDMIDAALAQ